MKNWRGREGVLNYLLLGENDLKNGKTLDIGSGTGQLAIDLAGQAEIVSYDPLSAPLILLGTNKPKLSEEIARKNAVRGIAQVLPFKDNTFERVISLYSVPRYFSTAEKATEFIREILRVLKMGGEIRLYPLIINSEEVSSLSPLSDYIKWPMRLRDRFLPLLEQEIAKDEKHKYTINEIVPDPEFPNQVLVVVKKINWINPIP